MHVHRRSSLMNATIETTRTGPIGAGRPGAANGPLAGRTVAVVHPAWHSCGAYEVYIGQVAAYRALGARVFSLACQDQPGFAPGSRRWQTYVALTPELDRAPRFFAGLSFPRFLRPDHFHRLAIRYWRGDGAAMREGFADLADISPEALATRVDLVHCNHFFCMPVARRLAANGGGSAPVVLDTIDVQARQFDLINEASWTLPPRVRFEAMLRQELEAMRPAAALLHLNLEEMAFFAEQLPQGRHHLLYPAVRAMAGEPAGSDILIVASNNTANVNSLVWFLREVLPAAGHPSVRIAGNVDRGVRDKDGALFERHRDSFLGRVDDLAKVYGRAKTILLPTIEGTGLSIKAVEALSTGLPLIASPLAFRGTSLAAAGLRNVVIAQDAPEFANALRAAASRPAPESTAELAESDTRQAYEAHFSDAAYARNLLQIVGPLVRAT